MANGNQQRCCLLGVCCPPGSAEQRAALKAWLLEKMHANLNPPGGTNPQAEERVDAWLDELPWLPLTDPGVNG